MATAEVCESVEHYWDWKSGGTAGAWFVAWDGGGVGQVLEGRARSRV